MASSIHQLMFVRLSQYSVTVSAASEFLLPVRMRPGKWHEGEIGSLGTTILASS